MGVHTLSWEQLRINNEAQRSSDVTFVIKGYSLDWLERFHSGKQTTLYYKQHQLRVVNK